MSSFALESLLLVSDHLLGMGESEGEGFICWSDDG